MRARFLSTAAALAAAGALLLGPASVALAADPAPVTWAVQPGNADGPDGRAWVELEAEPGTAHTDHIVVRNLGREDTTFALKAADAYFTDRGRFAMLPSSEPSVDAGTWVKAPARVTVKAGQEEVLPFEITVPDNATPGDHAAGLAATVTTPGTDAAGNSMGVESRVGFRVMVRVKGELRPALRGDASMNYVASSNPFEPGSAQLAIDLENNGNTRLAAGGTITVSGPFGWGKREVPLPAVDDTLPGERRSLSVRVDGVWPLFVSTASVHLTPASVEGQSFPEQPAVLDLAASATSIPWTQLALLAGLAAVVALALLLRRRRRAALEDRLRLAREQGRREALANTVPQAPAAEAHDGAARGPAHRAGPVSAFAWAPVFAASLVLLPLAGPSSPTSPAQADSGVRVDVSITALGLPTVSVTASPTATPTVSQSPGVTTTGTAPTSSTTTATTKVTPSGGQTTATAPATTASTLPETGAPGFLVPTALGALGLGLVGLLLVIARRARPRRH